MDKKKSQKESSPGDKSSLGHWWAGRASNQHLMCFQPGCWSYAAPMQGTPWLSHHWSDADRGTMTNCDAGTPTQCIHALERGNYAPLVSVEMLHLCLLPWLLRNAGCTANSTARQRLCFHTESLQTTKRAWKMDLCSPEACLARQEGKPKHCQKQERGWRGGTDIQGLQGPPQSSSYKPSWEVFLGLGFWVAKVRETRQLKMPWIFIYSVGTMNCDT